MFLSIKGKKKQQLLFMKRNAVKSTTLCFRM